MTTVPNWIAKAVIVEYGYGRQAHVSPTVEWRATKTQVIVRTSPTGPERRFYLNSLTAVGEPNSFPEMRTHLAAPDAPEVIAAQRTQVISRSRNAVITTVEKQRLQDSTDDAEALVAKLTAVQDAVNQALAALAEVL
jgi:hypothetical protein